MNLVPVLLLLQPPSFNVPVCRADAALRTLSQQADVRMTVEEPVASEIVFVKTSRLPLADVMKSLATVTCAAWSKSSDGSYILSRPDALREEVYKLEADRKRKIFDKWRAEVMAGLQQKFDPTSLSGLKAKREALKLRQRNAENSNEDWDAIQKGFLQSDQCDPIYRALARCIDGLDWTPVLNMASQTSVVYSSAPNAIQYPLGARSAEALSMLQVEQTAWSKMLGEVSPRQKDYWNVVFTFERDETPENAAREAKSGRSVVDPWEHNAAYDNPQIAVLSVDCQKENEYCLRFQIVGAGGECIACFAVQVNTPIIDQPIVADIELQDPPNSPDTAAAVLLDTRDAKNKKSALQEIRPYFFDPKVHEPLSLRNQELLTALSDQRKKDVIACLPDEAGMALRFVSPLSEYYNRPSNFGLVRTEAAQVIELKPRSFTSHWMHQISREAMANTARQMQEKGGLDYDTLSRLVATDGDYRASTFIPMFVRLMDIASDPRSSGPMHPVQPAYDQLYCLLTPSQLASLRSGKTLPYASLSQQQQRLAERIVYGPKFYSEDVGRPPEGLADIDPTFEMPNGLPSEGGLSADCSEQTLAVFYGVEENGKPTAIWGCDMAQLDTLRMWPTHVFNAPKGGLVNSTVGFVRRPQMSLRCWMSPNHYALGYYGNPGTTIEEKPVPFKSLPLEIRRKLQHTVDKIDKVSIHG